MYKQNKLPNKILLTGPSGSGKATFLYHFINYLLSDNEEHKYNKDNFIINPLNKSFRLVNQHCHPNFYLIDNFLEKQSIDIKQIRNMISYVNKTTYDKKIKLILIDNAEYLNLHSVNSLLKVVEEIKSNSFIFIVHNSSKKIIDTLRSRCLEFKVSFNYKQRKQILKNLIEHNNIELDFNNLKAIQSYYDSPGIMLKIINLINQKIIDLNEMNINKTIFDFMEFVKKNKNNLNMDLLQNFIEIMFLKKIKETTDKNNISLKYSKVLQTLNFSRKYNIDMNNTFYEIKENIIHG